MATKPRDTTYESQESARLDAQRAAALAQYHHEQQRAQAGKVAKLVDNIFKKPGGSHVR